ncbi:uncharacterized protein LOC129600728 [Paramacrobiotus metropolitanus]|uniref:uncharacterized protein LOC129600728 n=1 Tax=Paramacrobiotus metropolitanus TaxID=2943436 RepID=UPI002445DE3D|nr:uncharacterized protein LOC129600728 [Paramacrobiotus metropolitanus]
MGSIWTLLFYWESLANVVNENHKCYVALRAKAGEPFCFQLATLRQDMHETWQTETTLGGMLQTHLKSRDSLPPIRLRDARPPDAGLSSDAERTSAAIALLPPCLQSDILTHLDVHSQMRAKRVCALWQLLLSDARMAVHVRISFESCCDLQSDSDNCFKAAVLLSRSITSATLTLTFLPMLLRQHFILVLPWLNDTETHLRFIVFKDRTNNRPATISHRSSTGFSLHPAAHDAMQYEQLCNAILLINWAVGDLFGGAMFHAFECDPVLTHTRSTNLLRAREKDLMQPLTKESHALDIDKLQITIPRLLLKCSEGREKMSARFMHAVNANFPPVTEEMLAKVTAVHARWVRTLKYPEEWQSIHTYIIL